MSSPATPTDLRRTVFHAFHLERGAKMVEFAGWEMPLHYGSIIEEHHQVRRSGGLFDVSHMGRFTFSGRDARAFLDRVCTRQIAGMKDGQARYSLVCNERGGCRDDVLVYRIDEHEYMMVCNASNREKLIAHFEAVKGDLVFRFEDVTFETAMVAVQGPGVMEVIGRYSRSIPELKRFRFVRQNLLGLTVTISRTGYTGEDGVEVIFGTNNLIARTALKTLMKDLTAVGDVLRPAGLGARDSLRLEAAMALYGHEITEEIDPVSAGLGFAIKLDKGDDDPAVGRFIGQDALRAVAADGPARKLTGLAIDSPRAARQGMAVHHGDAVVGTVTSGVKSPTLERSIAMAYVDSGLTEDGTTLEVDLGRQRAGATVVPLPFYKP
jgi:aminomethyltransferase